MCHAELSETIEDYRNGRLYKEIYYEAGKPCGIPIELADLIIRVADLCAYCHIDLEEAIRIKAEYNKTCPHKHGGKII